MGKAKKNNRQKALKKYWKILAIVRKEYAKNKIKVTLKELRQDTSAIYPIFKNTPSNYISREKVLTARAGQEPYTVKPKKQQPLSKPIVHDELLEPVPYYTAANIYPDRIDKSENTLFISRISPDGINELRGGEFYDYETYFKDFTSHCNRLMKEAREKGLPSNSDNAPLVVCLPILDQNNKHKIRDGLWLYEIVSGTQGTYGEFINDEFGFDPSDLESMDGELNINKEQSKESDQPEIKTTETKEEVAVTGFDVIRIQTESEERIKLEKIQSEERIKREEIESQERIKTKKLDDLKDLLVSKVISLDEYLKAINEIK